MPLLKLRRTAHAPYEITVETNEYAAAGYPLGTVVHVVPYQAPEPRPYWVHIKSIDTVVAAEIIPEALLFQDRVRIDGTEYLCSDLEIIAEVVVKEKPRLYIVK